MIRAYNECGCQMYSLWSARLTGERSSNEMFGTCPAVDSCHGVPTAVDTGSVPAADGGIPGRGGRGCSTVFTFVSPVREYRTIRETGQARRCECEQYRHPTGDDPRRYVHDGEPGIGTGGLWLRAAPAHCEDNQTVSDGRNGSDSVAVPAHHGRESR